MVKLVSVECSVQLSSKQNGVHSRETYVLGGVLPQNGIVTTTQSNYSKSGSPAPVKSLIWRFVEHFIQIQNVNIPKRVRLSAVSTEIRTGASAVQVSTSHCRNSHNKLECRKAIAVKERRYCNCFQVKCLLFSNPYHWSVKNSIIIVHAYLKKAKDHPHTLYVTFSQMERGSSLQVI